MLSVAALGLLLSFSVLGQDLQEVTEATDAAEATKQQLKLLKKKESRSLNRKKKK